MIIESLLGFLSSLDKSDVASMDRLKGKFSVNTNRNRIRSISDYSSNSIFYFTTVTSDQVTPEEMAMCARFLEKSYASFVVACVGLMPFHRIKADDQASIEEYLRQFHQNIAGVKGAGVASRLIGYSGYANKLKAIGESADVSNSDVENFLMECWEHSKSNCTDYVKTVIEGVKTLDEMYDKPAVDNITKALTEAHRAAFEELNTWGFIGEATADMFDDLDALSDQELIKLIANDHDDDEYNFEDEDDLEDQYPELDDMLGESIGGIAAAAAVGGAMANNLGSDIYNGLKKVGKKIFKKGAKAIKNSVKDDDEGSESQDESAVDSVMFTLQAVTENRIKNCSSLAKLGSYEGKLNKLKNKYANYLNRYKRKYAANKETGSKSKLHIRFNNTDISNPKAFMKEYGNYIKIINQRLAMVETRRKELRNAKGLPDASNDAALEEAGQPVLSDYDLEMTENCIKVIDDLLRAPDSEVFTIVDEAINFTGKLSNGVVKDVSPTNGDNEELDEPQIDPDQARHNEKVLDSVSRMQNMEKEIAYLKQRSDSRSNPYQKNPNRYSPPKGVAYRKDAPSGNIHAASARGGASFETFGKSVFTDMDMKKANDMIPTFAKASIGFIVDQTEQVVTRDVLIGIKVWIHRMPARDLINDIYNAIINKRKFLKFVKYVSGEEKSLTDLLFGIKELKTDAMAAGNKNSHISQWIPAFRRRKRWAKMSVPYLMSSYTPNGTVNMTQNEVDFIKDEYGVDISTPAHVEMLMEHNFLLGFVVLDQANEIIKVSYDGRGGQFEEYTYAMAERSDIKDSDRLMREMYRTFAR